MKQNDYGAHYLSTIQTWVQLCGRVLQGVNNPIPQKITSHKIVSLETECNTKAWVSSGVGEEIAEGMYIISNIILGTSEWILAQR